MAIEHDPSGQREDGTDRAERSSPDGAAQGVTDLDSRRGATATLDEPDDTRPDAA